MTSSGSSSDPYAQRPGRPPEFDANEARTCIAAIGAAVDDAEVIALMASAARALGGDAAMFTAFTHDDAMLTTYRSLHACDPAWPSLCASHRWATDDPWLDHARRVGMPVLATDIAVRGDRQQAIVDAAARHGFASAVIVPALSLHGPSRVGVLCIGSGVVGHFEAHGIVETRALLRGMAMELHDWCQQRMRQELRVRAHLSDDDLLLLRHEAEGHGSKDIARALQTQSITIDCRFQRLNSRLGVANRRDAVRLARLYGLL